MPISLKEIFLLNERFDVPHEYWTPLKKLADDTVAVAIKSYMDVMMNVTKEEHNLPRIELLKKMEDWANANGVNIPTPEIKVVKKEQLPNTSIISSSALAGFLYYVKNEKQNINCAILIVIDPLHVIGEGRYYRHKNTVVIPVGVGDFIESEFNAHDMAREMFRTVLHEVLHYFQDHHNKPTVNVLPPEGKKYGVFTGKYPVGLGKKKYRNLNYTSTGFPKPLAGKTSNQYPLNYSEINPAPHPQIPAEFYPLLLSIYDEIKYSIQNSPELKPIPNIWDKFKEIIKNPTPYLKYSTTHELNLAKSTNIKLYNGFLKELYKMLLKDFPQAANENLFEDFKKEIENQLKITLPSPIGFSILM